MLIDEPVNTLIRQAQEEIDEQSYLPLLASRLGLAGVAAVTLSSHPFVAQIVTTLLTSGPARFQERFLTIATELEIQQKRIESKIPDKNYYQSEEFQTLFVLLAERLHTTHQQEKLKMFGNALANSGSEDFRGDDTELYVRLIRDLSLVDLRALQDLRLQSTYTPSLAITYTAEEIARFSRLASMGILVEQQISGYGGGPPRIGNDRHYFLAELGRSLFRFISGECHAPDTNTSV